MAFDTPDQKDWFDHPLDARAAKGGEYGLDGKLHKGGEFLPHYVPRAIMPQVDETDLDALLAFLTGKGIGIRRETLPCDAFKVMQRVDEAHVQSMISGDQSALLAKPVLASNDPDIVDGNHRLAAHKALKSAVPAIIIDLPFEHAIAAVFEFPKTYALGNGVTPIRD